MKLLIITSIKECREAVAAIFNQTAIDVFSVAEITSFKANANTDLTRSWFGVAGMPMMP